MDDEHAGVLLRFADGLGEIAAHGAGAFGGGILGGLGFDTGVVLGDLLCEGVVGTEDFEEGGSGESAGGELGGAFEEVAPADAAVGVVVVEVEEGLGEGGGGWAVHRAVEKG